MFSDFFSLNSSETYAKKNSSKSEQKNDVREAQEIKIRKLILNTSLNIVHSLGEKKLATIGDNLADFLRIFCAKSTISQTIKIAKIGKFIFHKFQHNAHLLF